MSSKNTDEHYYDCDVIIVGGGPSGVICAITLAKQGHNAVIVDKKSLEDIGDKTCGDAVDLAALDRIKEGIGITHPKDSEVSDQIKLMSIAAGSVNTKLTLNAPGFVVDRHNYGQRLLNEAKQLGVEVIPNAAVRELIFGKYDGQTYLDGIKYNQDGQKKELRAKFTIDASGAYAVIRRQLPDEFLQDGITNDLSDDDVWPTYREIIKLENGQSNHNFLNEIVLLYKNDFPPPGYFWIFSKGDMKLNCGIGWSKTQSKKFGSIKNVYYTEMENYYPKNAYSIIKSGGGQIPGRPPFDSLVFNGGALAGDAACLVNPTTLEGHGPALSLSMNLGFTLSQALKNGQRSRESLWDYNVICSQHYAKKHTQSLLLRKFLEDVGADGLQFLIKKSIFRNEEMDVFFTGGSLVIPFSSKLIRGLKLLQKPKLLFWIRKIFNDLQKCEEIFAKYPSNPHELDNWREMRNNELNLNY